VDACIACSVITGPFFAFGDGVLTCWTVLDKVLCASPIELAGTRVNSVIAVVCWGHRDGNCRVMFCTVYTHRAFLVVPTLSNCWINRTVWFADGAYGGSRSRAELLDCC
jgi:hypothetical protein